jgi:hypothetical protein
MSHVPEQLKGSEFEQLLKEAAAKEEKAGSLTMDHYGVTLSVQNGVTMGIQSKPDFEGVLAGGRQFVFEAKVCSGASFPMTKDKIKPRQISHMLKRSRFGVPCFLLIHFTARNLVKSSTPATTIAIPVSDADPRWQRFVDAYATMKREKANKVDPQGSISRDEAQDMGQLVPWTIPKGCRKALPDLLSFLWPEARAAIEIPTVKPTPTIQPDNWD